MDDTAAPGTGGETRDEGRDLTDRALTVAHAHPQDQDQEQGVGSERVPGHWRYELRRWLATLNPGRTGREYEKAVSYFFSTSGVPALLSELSFDLLLAYRGALALRAAPAERGAAYTARTPLSSAVALGTAMHDSLPGPSYSAADAKYSESEGEDTHTDLRPLAPATVNIRLTALRQFLVHCSMMGLLVDLPPDRIRMALKRLQIDRRRPYQVLAESEWAEFLAAAALPTALHSAAPSAANSATKDSRDANPIQSRSPWGVPRALRVQAPSKQDAEAHETTEHASARQPLVRSRAGLTGERTAQRDHALIALALATGLRAIEISLLDLGDLTREWHDGQEEWWLVLPDAKTKGQHGGRSLPLAAPLIAELLEYVRSTGRRLESASDRNTPLFLSTRGSGSAHRSATAHGRLTPGQIGRIVDRVEAQWVQHRDISSGEMRAISPHALRHSTAMALLQGSADGTRPPASVEHVRGWLGHFDIRTTQGYLAHLEGRHHRRSLKITLSGDSSRTNNDRADPGRKEEEGDTD